MSESVGRGLPVVVAGGRSLEWISKGVVQLLPPDSIAHHALRVLGRVERRVGRLRIGDAHIRAVVEIELGPSEIFIECYMLDGFLVRLTRSSI